MIGSMTAKDNEELIARVPQLPKKRPENAAAVLLETERQDTSRYRLTDAQAREIACIQRDIREGRTGLATDEHMTALWKSCGL
jgi:hypothetical protein